MIATYGDGWISSMLFAGIRKGLMLTLLTMFGVVAGASPGMAATNTVTVGTVSGVAGRIVQVPVTITGANTVGSGGVGGVLVSITYDTNLISPVLLSGTPDVLKGTGLPNGWIIKPSISPQQAGSTIATLQLQIYSKAGAPLTAASAELALIKFNVPSSATKNIPLPVVSFDVFDASSPTKPVSVKASFSSVNGQVSLALGASGGSGTPGAAVAANTRPVGNPPGTFSVDKSVTFVLQLFDKSNNKLIKGGDTVTVGGVSLKGASFSPVTDNNNGTYSVTYTPGVPGSEKNIFFTVNGSAHQNISALTVTPGASVAANATATWVSATITADQTATLTIQLKDQFNNKLVASGGVVAVKSSALAGSAVLVRDNKNGTYTVIYTPKTAGIENLTFTVAGVAGSAVPTLTVNPGAAVVANTQPVGNPPGTFSADKPVTFVLQLFDKFKNQLGKGGDIVTMSGVSLKGASFSPVTDNNNGTYSVTYTPGATGIEKKLFLAVNGSAHQNISALTITPGAAVAANAAATWTSSAITADQTATLTIQLKDKFNNKLVASGGVVAVKGNALAGSAVLPVRDNKNGTYTATYTTGKVGSETLIFTVNGKPGSTVPTLTVTHGAADHIVTTVNPATINPDGKSTAVVTATIVDKKGNNAAATATVTFSASPAALITLPLKVTSSAINGVAHLTVTSKASTTSGSVTLSATASGLATVASNTPAILHLTTFILNKTAIKLIAGDTFAFTLSNGTANSTWVLTGPKKGVAAGGSLSTARGAKSIYTAGAKAGVDTLTVTDAGGKSTTTVITVRTAVTTGITATTGIATGRTSSKINASGGDGHYTYTSSNTKVLTVDKTGKMTAVKAGTATVTVTDGTTYNGATKANKVTTAKIVVVDKIAVTSGGTIELDTKSHKTAMISVTGGSSGNTFTSSNKAVATVNANGLVTAVGAGVAVITVSEATNHTSIATVTVHVRAPLGVKDAAGTAALTVTQTIPSGGSLTVTPAGGSGKFSADVTRLGFSKALVADASGNFTLTPPTTGAFAGSYTLTLTDTTSGFTSTLTINVPLKVTVSRLNILESDKTQTVTITGGAAGDVFHVVVLNVLKKNAKGKPTPDTGKIVANLANVTATTTPATGNPATATIVPVNPVTSGRITPFAIQATDTTQSALQPVDTLRMHIIPEVLRTLTVTNSATGMPISGATVTLRFAPPIIKPANVATTTNKKGVATPTLPVGRHVFSVTKSGFMPSVIKLAQGVATGSVALTPITSLITYSGTIIGKDGFSLPATTMVVAVDASGNAIRGKVKVASGGASATFTLALDANAFTPVTFIASAPGANSDDIDAQAGVFKIGPFSLEKEETDIPEVDLAKAVDLAKLRAEFNAGTVYAPTTVPSALKGLVTPVKTIKIANKPAKGAKSTPGGSVTVTASDDVVFQVMKDAAGAILSVPAVYKPLSNANGQERRDVAGTKQLRLGNTTTPKLFNLTKLTTLKSIGVLLPANAFKANPAHKAGKVMATVSGVKFTSAKSRLTGDELVEIDLAIFDKGGAVVLSTRPGNAVLNSVLVQVPIDPNALVALGFDSSTANAAFASGKLVIYTAPSVTDFEAGNTTIVPGSVTYDPLSGKASFYTNHFSVFGAGAAGAGAAGASAPIAAGGGGGCVLNPAAGGPWDPVLPALVLIAAGWLWRRKRAQ